MKPLYVLISVFAICLLISRLTMSALQFSLAGRIAMSAMLLFTAIGHFAFVDGMKLMLPPLIPFKTAIVYFTGIIEVAAAIALFFSSTRVMAAYMLIIFFVIILPANICAAFRNVDYQSANYNGPGLNYLWFRIPLQVFFIFWIYFSVLSGRSSKEPDSPNTNTEKLKT